MQGFYPKSADIPNPAIPLGVKSALCSRSGKTAGEPGTPRICHGKLTSAQFKNCWQGLNCMLKYWLRWGMVQWQHTGL
jgi:hypothetical protein